MLEERDKRPLNIINHYGPKHQQEILKGEYEELQEAIDKVEARDQKELNEYHKEILIDEVADVLVMLLEYIQYYELSKEAIEARVDFKLNRRRVGRLSATPQRSPKSSICKTSSTEWAQGCKVRVRQIL